MLRNANKKCLNFKTLDIIEIKNLTLQSGKYAKHLLKKDHIPLKAQERKKKIQNFGMNFNPLVNSIRDSNCPHRIMYNDNPGKTDCVLKRHHVLIKLCYKHLT